MLDLHDPAARAERERHRRSARRRAGWRRRGVVLLLLSPWLVGFFVFTLYPIVNSLYWSFTVKRFGQPAVWVGLENYRLLLSNPDLALALRNTAYLAAVGLPIRMFIALLAAALLARPRRGNGTYRLLFFVPSVVPAVASGALFFFLLKEGGPVSSLFALFGAEAPLWFRDPAWAKPALIMVGTWALGDIMLIFLAGLVDIPRSLYEAIELDGAGRWARFRHVTLPMISPVTFFVLLTGMIGVLQSFDQAFVFSQGVREGRLTGEPQGSLLTYAMLQLRYFQDGRIGFASAMAWVMFLITLVITVAMLLSRRRWVHTAVEGGA
jgi:multiple sugar transport system permease protein